MDRQCVTKRRRYANVTTMEEEMVIPVEAADRANQPAAKALPEAIRGVVLEAILKAIRGAVLEAILEAIQDAVPEAILEAILEAIVAAVRAATPVIMEMVNRTLRILWTTLARIVTAILTAKATMVTATWITAT